ncbi:MAG: sigma 54-interacting transcriptional regulator [Myxococcota bacterium]
MPQLQFHESGRPLFVHVLRGGRTVIGRSDSCDLALPSDSVSRVHCMIDGRPEGWFVQDRSRHGTQVNGKRVDGTVPLADEDEISIGTYRARFVLKEDPSLRGATATAPVAAAIHEEVVEGNEEVFAAGRAEVRFVRGPHAGRTVVLGQARTSVGGPSAAIELDDKLPRGATYLRVVRGRPMVEPGALPVFLAGARVREVTPVLAGEEVRVGEHGFLVEITTIEDKGRELDSFGEMVGRSAPMRRLFGVLQRIAGHDAPVLLNGESGTGKELAARALHDAGPQFDGPYVAVNCAAIADTLFESELFGHEKGSFTGANQRVDGAFHRADRGTLFLDEIGEMHLDLQAKLLRVLESGEVRRVGGAEPEYPDVRVISATNRNLQDMVRQGRFRQDLYFRLAVLTVRLPSLRERADDIPIIAQTLLARHHPGARLTPDAQQSLKEYEWPGNVRELRNVLTRAFVMTGANIAAGDLTFNPWSFEDPTGAGPAAPAPVSLRPTSLGGADPEREVVERALSEAGGNRTQAARILGIPRSSLLYKLNKYGLLTR